MHCSRRVACWLMVALAVMAALGIPGAFGGSGPLFLVDDEHPPVLKISWPTRAGGEHSFQGRRNYLAAEDSTPLGANLKAYVAMGGTRLEARAADPRGAIVRAGFYKIDGGKWLFQDIAPGSAVTITLSGIRFNQPAAAQPHTLVHHAKFDDPNSLLGCGASAAAATRDNLVDHYNTADPGDSLNGRITSRNGRLGILDGASDQGGTVRISTEKDGSITMTVTIPYALFKHPDDPWLRSNPGDFIEPFHFHVEFEILPADAAPAAQPVIRPPPSQPE